MNDEFEAVLDDGSAEEVAVKIVGLRKLALQGDFTIVDEMTRKWEERQRRGGDTIRCQHVERAEDEDDTDWDSDDSDQDPDGEDTEMVEAPPLVRIPKEKVPPEVDDEGFTKVVGKKKR